MEVCSNYERHAPTLHFFFIVFLLITQSFCQPFQDVSYYAGIEQPYGRTAKYGGAAIADLDGDGWPDLLCGNHGDSSMQVYFNNRNGTFSVSPFYLRRDIHGLTPFRPFPKSRTMYFIVSVGGNRGKRRNHPQVFRVHWNRTIIDVSDRSPDIMNMFRRGRSAIPISLRIPPPKQEDKENRQDLVLLNRQDGTNTQHRAFEVEGTGKLEERTLRKKKMISDPGEYAMATDVDGDGSMELVTIRKVNMYKVVSDFVLQFISRQVFPGYAIDYAATLSAAELDFDNDGRFDLFLAQSSAGINRLVRRSTLRDRLMRNVGGRYVDVTERARIPMQRPYSHGVTVADFDNDGWIDIFITRFDSKPSYRLLRNKGDGTFEIVQPGFSRRSYIDGDMATAVDYDRDGRVDLIVSEGSWDRASPRRGNYRVIRNTWVTGNGFILVRVRNAPAYAVTSLHALVIVSLPDGSKRYRRVGSSGTLVSNSYIELVHVGIGKHVRADVSVTWTDGSRRITRNVRANATVTFGA